MGKSQSKMSLDTLDNQNGTINNKTNNTQTNFTNHKLMEEQQIISKKLFYNLQSFQSSKNDIDNNLKCGYLDDKSTKTLSYLSIQSAKNSIDTFLFKNEDNNKTFDMDEYFQNIQQPPLHLVVKEFLNQKDENFKLIRYIKFDQGYHVFEVKGKNVRREQIESYGDFQTYSVFLRGTLIEQDINVNYQQNEMKDNNDQTYILELIQRQTTHTDIEYCIFENFQCDLEYILHKKENLSYYSIISFAIQLAKCLQFLEKYNINNINIQPSNIYYLKEINSFKLGRSIKKFQIQQVQIDQLRGSIYKYTAPEILNQQINISRKADIYSLGIIILELILNDELQIQDIIEIQNGEINKFEIKDELFKDLDDIVKKMLINNPQDRIDSKTLVEQLEQIKQKELNEQIHILSQNVSKSNLKNVIKNFQQPFLEINENKSYIQQLSFDDQEVNLKEQKDCLNSVYEDYFISRFTQNQSPKDKRHHSYKLESDIQQRVKYHLCQLYPSQYTQIDENIINFFCEYKLIQQKMQIEESQIKFQRQKTIESYERLESILKQRFNEKKLYKGKEIALLALYKYYRSQGFNLNLDDSESKFNNKQQLSYADQYQLQIIQSGKTQQLKYFQLKFEDSQEFNYELINSDTQFRFQILQQIRNAVSYELKISNEQVIIFDINKGSTYISFIVKDSDYQIEEISTNTFIRYGLPEPIIQIKTLLDNFQLSYDLFNPTYNMYWIEKTDQKRGSLFFQNKNKYKPQPYNLPVGYKGYGLNISSWLGEDRLWISMGCDPETWIVLYHGTNTKGGVTGIIIDQTINPGKRNLYGENENECRITGKIIKKGEYENTYLADNVDDKTGSGGYSNDIDIVGQNYKMIFQCRVNPQVVRSPKSFKTYYTVDSTQFKENIRPYRILLKKVN